MADGMFIQVEVAPQAAKDTELTKKLIEVCPVNSSPPIPREAARS